MRHLRCALLGLPGLLALVALFLLAGSAGRLPGKEQV